MQNSNSIEPNSRSTATSSVSSGVGPVSPIFTDAGRLPAVRRPLLARLPWWRITLLTIAALVLTLWLALAG